MIINDESAPIEIESRAFSHGSIADLEKQIDSIDVADHTADDDFPAEATTAAKKEWFEEDQAATGTSEEDEDSETKARLDALELNEPWRKNRLNRESQKRQAAEQARAAADQRAEALEAELAQYRSGKPAQQVPTTSPQGQIAPDDAQMEEWIVSNVPQAQRAKMDLDAAMDLSKYATTGEAVIAINKAQRSYDRTVDQVKIGIQQEIQREATQKQAITTSLQQKANIYLETVGKSTLPNFPKILSAFQQNARNLHDTIISAVIDYPEPDLATAAIMSSKANFEFFQNASRDPSKIPAALAKLGALTEAYRATIAKPIPRAAIPTSAPAAAPRATQKASSSPDVPRGETAGGGDVAYYEKLFRKDPVAYTKGVMSKKYPDINGILDN